MWPQTYTPLGSLIPSALVAALPIAVMLYLLGIARKRAWIAGLTGCGTALLIALFVYRMPWNLAFNSLLYGAAYGLLPIGWIVFTAILLYRLAVDTGKFEIIKDSIGHLTSDTYMQALVIAFAFGAFIEGASGFGSPVAVAAAMLVGLGMPAFEAAAICLLANTAPVAFGAIGTPIVGLQSVTNLPMMDLSANVGRLCAPLALFVPIYVIAVMGGKKALAQAGAAALACGAAFAIVQFLVSSYIGPYLTAILSSLAAMGAMVVICILRRKPGEHAASRHSAGAMLLAWSPYIFLVIFVLILNGDQIVLPKPYDVLWPAAKFGAFKAFLNNTTTSVFGWPGLHNLVQKMPPVVKAPSPYAANYTFNPLTTSGTAALYAVFATAILLRVPPRKLANCFWQTMKQLAMPTLTIASVLGLAYLMNYSGATATLGLTIAATGAAFPFFSAILGWIGVFLTGSDTSANALFGNLQVVTANSLGFNPSLMASANSAGGVMGKMISLQSIAVAGAATGLKRAEEAQLMRFTVKHSIFLAAMTGLVTLFFAYVMPSWVR
ncbi:MAG: lactate permease LctP family transporter [Bryobacterales bacterium]|nr:lactate permease LctP family transporter [Bryobacterales bacterium]MBV9400476.1 lactate permease LctP family transporter [Bryobacterales bacterium]